MTSTDLALHLLPQCDPARFARLGAGLLASVERDRIPRLVLAELDGESVVLGRFQRASETLDLERIRESGRTVMRRLGGGRALAAGSGALGLLLGLPNAGAFLPRPVGPDRLLNRHVRGLLAGLTASGAGAGASYFGRDFVSAESKQIAVLSQDGTPSGAVVLEAVAGITRSLALPAGWTKPRPHRDPRVAGPPAASLSDLWTHALSPEEVSRRIAAAYATIYQCALVEDVPLFDEGSPLDPPVMEEEPAFWPSAAREVPIGFVDALVRADGERILSARVRGDFIAPAFAVRTLEASLAGSPLDAAEVGMRVDAAFRARGAMILGVATLRDFADALLEAGGKP